MSTVSLSTAVGWVLGAAVLSVILTWVVAGSRYAAQVAGLRAERDGLRERIVDLEATVTEDAQAAALLAPLRDAVTRVERQVATLERDRSEQYGVLGERLAEVSASAAALRAETATLAGSLNASTVRGTWGEVQLRRVLEHAGMLRRCDLDEQVSATARHGREVRPDVVVRLPGGKVLVIDAKAPMTAFLGAQADGVDAAGRHTLLQAHAKALRGHVDSLAAKAYWSAFATTPEMVLCFVPGDAVLAAALAADPELYEYAQRSRVVLSSPATLLAVLRAVAFTWQQDALASNARELLSLGADLYERLGTLAGHVDGMGRALTRGVESYNALVGSLETRVLTTARRMHDLGVSSEALPTIPPLSLGARHLTAPELVSATAHGSEEHGRDRFGG